MEHYTTKDRREARACFATLQEFARREIQAWLQKLLEEEVAEVVGRGRYERRRAVDAPMVYRNGRGKARTLTTALGAIEVNRPRVRGLEERFRSLILPLFVRRTREVDELLPELYLHGLAERDFDLALRGLLGEKAPLSATSVARLKAAWKAEYEAWRTRDLSDLEPVYVWADGVYVKAGLEKDKAAVLVVVAALRDGRKTVLAVEAGHRESSESWGEVLRSLRDRGLPAPRLVVADGHLGIWGALAEVFPGAREQRCWNHKIRNVLDKVPKRLREEAKALVTAVPYAESRAEAEKRRRSFESWCRKRDLSAAAETLGRDWERMTTFYAFPREHWKHLRTTNVIESPFAAVRLRTDAARRYKRAENATAVIWKTLLLAESRMRRLDAPHLLAEVAEGAKYEDGIRTKGKREKRGSGRHAA